MDIYNNISKKLKELKFDLSTYKVTLHKINKKEIYIINAFLNFSNYKTFLLKHIQFCKNLNLKNLKSQNLKQNIFFKMVLNFLLNQFTKKGFLKKTSNGFRSTAVLKYCVFEANNIIKIFLYLIRNIVNFYSFLHNKSDL